VDRHRAGRPGHHRRGVHRALRHQQFEQQQDPGYDDGPENGAGNQTAADDRSTYHDGADNRGAHDHGNADNDCRANNYHHRRLDDLSAGPLP
jgi:hypothetical protein